MLDKISEVILCTLFQRHDWSTMHMGNTVQHKCKRCGLYYNQQFVDLYDEAQELYDTFTGDGTVFVGIDCRDDAQVYTEYCRDDAQVYVENCQDDTQITVESVGQVSDTKDDMTSDDPCTVLKRIEQGDISLKLYSLTDTQMETLMSILSVECDAIVNQDEPMTMNDHIKHRPRDYHARYDTFDALMNNGFLRRIDDKRDSTAEYILSLPDE